MIRRWLCYWFGHPETITVDGDWGPKIVWCSRCGAVTE